MVREHGVGRYYLLREFVVKLLEEVATKAAARTTGDRVDQHKAFKTIGTFGLAINHIENLFLELIGLGVAAGPVISGPTALLRDEDILRIVECRIGAILN